MKFLVAAALVIVSMTAAEPPRPRQYLSRQTQSNPQYAPRGWKPERLQNPPTPAPSYGPPARADAFGTEAPTTTEGFTVRSPENLEVESIEVDKKSGKVNSAPAKLKQDPEAPFFVVLPKAQNLVYSVPQKAAIVTIPQAKLVAAPAKLEVLQPVQLFAYDSAYTNQVVTPFSSSYVQVYH